MAATPESVKKLIALGAEITIEAGAGAAASYTDQAYTDAGANIVPDAASAAAAGDIVFKIQRPMSAAEGVDEIGLLRSGQTLMSPLGALTNKELVAALAAKGVTAFALELIPRTSFPSSQRRWRAYPAICSNRRNPLTASSRATRPCATRRSVIQRPRRRTVKLRTELVTVVRLKTNRRPKSRA